ncbi:hypothetical protein P4V43_05325 [Brevibacillus fortis]|uniref:hypothetical protein n=1 Tax=Brevibacillus fortis TaxID=2126352 RepID=UPI002E22921E|nr:hypothetical protein [Brevibacillus fortis]
MAQTKSKKVVGLFVAAALAISGCSSGDDYDEDCYDNDNDGYCDDSSSSGSSGSTYRSYKSKSGVSSGISTSSSKGGIGSSGYSSSG